MELLAKVAGFSERLLNKVLAIIIILAILFCGYAMWDTYKIFSSAKPNQDILKFKPTISDDGTNPSLSELEKINPDVRAWITVDNSSIDYPVLQGKNNMRYINTDIYGNYELAGSIFLDYRNAPDFSDSYSLLYGHHMDASAMFGDLTHFGERQYFDAHRTGTLFTKDKTYTLSIFACVEADAYDEVFFQPMNSKTEMKTLISAIEKNAVQFDKTVPATGNIIGLSTCSSVSTMGRTLVFAYMH